MVRRRKVPVTSRKSSFVVLPRELVEQVRSMFEVGWISRLISIIFMFLSLVWWVG
jgi:hypothetical protein